MLAMVIRAALPTDHQDGARWLLGKKQCCRILGEADHYCIGNSTELHACRNIVIVTKRKSEIANVNLFMFFTSKHYKIGPLHAVIQMWTCLGISILILPPPLPYRSDNSRTPDQCGFGDKTEGAAIARFLDYMLSRITKSSIPCFCLALLICSWS